VDCLIGPVRAAVLWWGSWSALGAVRPGGSPPGDRHSRRMRRAAARSAAALDLSRMNSAEFRG